MNRKSQDRKSQEDSNHQVSGEKGKIRKSHDDSNIVSSADELNTPNRSGPIYCKTWGIFTQWGRFYAELVNHVLYISLMKGGMVKKSFHLRSNTICEDNSTRPFCFQLRTPNTKETLLLATENIASKEIWVDSIQASLSLLRLADRKLRDKDKKKYHEEAVKQYITRPIIYFKVIRARNLTAKDTNGLSDPYVKIKLGSSTVKTTTRKKSLNPDWGMVFSFDWDMTMRYAVVEVWDEDFSSADDFLGIVYIPVFSFYDGYTSKAWYPLGKRSHKSTVSGEIEIEISCSGQPDSDLLAWQFFCEVQKLPEFSLNLVAQEDGSGQIGLKAAFVTPDYATTDTTPRGSLDSNHRPNLDGVNLQTVVSGDAQTEFLTHGFPLFFPSIEIETLEDISLSCEMVISINSAKIHAEGVLLLTSHRLIFITLRRILSERNPETGALKERDTITSSVSAKVNDDMKSGIESSDLTTQIHLATIHQMLLASENDEGDTNISYDALKVKTSDCRVFTFLFKDDGLSAIMPNAGNIFNKAIDTIFGSTQDMALKRRPTNTGIDSGLPSPKVSLSPFYEGGDILSSGKNGSTDMTQSNKRKQSILKSYNNHSAENSVAVLSQYGNLSKLEVAWLNIARGNQVQSIEASEASEGPPSHRISARIRNKSVNRGIERYRLLVEHYELINDIRSVCGLGGAPPPSMYDLEIRVSEKAVDPDAIYLNGIVHQAIEFSIDRESLTNSKLSLSGGYGRNSESSLNPSDLSHRVHLPLGWTNSITEEGKFSEGSRRRRKSSLSELIKRVQSTEGARNHFTKLLFNLENGWKVYDAALEFRRMGVPNGKWRISSVNSQYDLCLSYPAVLAVPESVDDDTLTRAAAFRSKNRVPTLCWLHPKLGTSISRSSQPLAGLGNNRSADDEKIISEINKCITPVGDTNGHRHDNPFIIVDARPLLNAKAQQAVGKGVENDKNYENTSVLFMDIPNIHAVRKSLEILEDAVHDELNFSRNLEISQWLVFLYRILTAANRIVHCVHREKISILVHCSDGWDRTSQLTSVSLILLDDYYRTLDGFIILIEKEWISFGHKFADRLGWTQEGWKDEERSPIFFQFLDCIHQLLHQLPNAFEFNSQLLLFIAEHLSSGYFGNFFFNHECELKESQPWHYSFSIWSVILGNRQAFINPNYVLHEGPINPIILRGKIVFWEDWFFRWQDKVWLNNWVYYNDTNIKKRNEIIWAEDHAAMACCKCNKKFTLFRRRHHCRCCGLIFCDVCTAEARIIPAISRWRSLRCCEECASAIDLTQAEINASRRTTRRTAESGLSRGAATGGGSF